MNWNPPAEGQQKPCGTMSKPVRTVNILSRILQANNITYRVKATFPHCTFSPASHYVVIPQAHGDVLYNFSGPSMNAMVTRCDRLIIFFLFCVFPLMMVTAASADIVYQFERLWPNLLQPWYFSFPEAVAIDANNNVYIADTGTTASRNSLWMVFS